MNKKKSRLERTDKSANYDDDLDKEEFLDTFINLKEEEENISSME